MHHIRRGTGKPLLLIHGLGGNWQSWNPILADLAATREVIAVDLPGFGQTPKLASATSIRTLADATAAFLRAEGLEGIDAVGSSMGARLVLELARRGGSVGGVVALNPGGFWQGWERHAFFSSIYLSVRLLRLLRPVLPAVCANPISRALLLAQFSARPTKLAPAMVSDELCSYVASPAFDELLHQLAYGETQLGAPRNSIAHPLVIGWGRRDRVCFPRQASRALALFPDARLHWFDRCGHFPHWDAPAETVQLILSALGGAYAGNPAATTNSPTWEDRGFQPTTHSSEEESMTTQTETAILAGGCFWGMEELLRRIPGVLSTRVGYTGGDVPNATYRNHGTHAEALEVVFDPARISYRQILEFFFQIHDPTTENRQGNDRGMSYRSGIYYLSDAQKHMAEQTIADVDASGLWPGKAVTEVAAAGPFWEAEPEHQDYLVHNPNGYTCHFIRPGWKLPARDGSA